MDHSHDGSACAGEQLTLVQLPVRDGEEDEPEERVERGTQQGEEVAHAGYDLGEDEGDDPDTGHHGGPDTPSDDGVAVGVSGFAHDAEVDELGADVRVDDADDNGGDDDEREGSLLVCRDA